MKNALGKTIGGILFVGATAAIWLWPRHRVEMPADTSVRPVRSMLVTEGFRQPDLHFAGRVKANKDRTLCFKQAGRLQRIPVSAGRPVKKGDKLAWLDPLDFENDLAKAEAAEKRDRLTCMRKREAAKKKAISEEEVSQAEAQLKQSEAQLALARRALEETVLLAPFDGTIAEVPATELDMVSPNVPIVLVHDLSKIKVDAVIPETIAILQRRMRATGGTNCVCSVATISLDSVPGRSFPARFVEYVSNADTKTQTYVATYEMDAPADLMVMPGMSATLFVSGKDYTYESDVAARSVSVPEAALGVADDGSHFVWVLEESAERGVWAARRRKVAVLSRANGFVALQDGVRAGERVATAGVAELTEGRRVRLLGR